MKKQLKKLKELRMNNKISCKEIAEILNISKTYYWQIENGDRRLSYELAKKIANVFRVRPDDIFFKDL